MKKTIPHLPAALIIGSLLFTPTIEAKTMYRLKTFGAITNPLSFDSPYNTYGTAINDSGVVTGTINYETPDAARTFISNPDGTLTALGTLTSSASGDSIGADINASGQIVGESSAEESPGVCCIYHAFLAASNGDMLDIGDNKESTAYAINDNGQVTGSYTNNAQTHAFLTTAAGPMIDLGTLGGTFSEGHAINNSAQVTGMSLNSRNGDYHAFITDADGLNMRELIPDGQHFSSGAAINASGQVVGVSNQHAFVTGPNGDNPQALVGLDETASFANDINDAGFVVGTYTHPKLGDRSFIADANRNAKDLDSLLIAEDPTLCTSLAVNDINNSGQITGMCSNDNSAFAFILKPEDIQPVSADKKNSIKLSESQQDTLNCDAEKNCSVDTAASGSYALTLKLSADTLNSHGIDLSQLQTSTRFAFNTGSYAFSGSLSSADPNKKQQTPTSLPAAWTAQHSECKKYAADNSCSQTKTVVDGSVKISTDKKHNLTITLKGKKTTVNGEVFGQQLLAGLCPTATSGNSQVIDSALFSIGTAPLPMTVKLDCTVKQRTKTVAGTAYVLNSVTGKAVLTAEP